MTRLNTGHIALADYSLILCVCSCIHTHSASCEFEPPLCPVLAAFRFCKEPRFLSITQQCCKSCPLQATPIPLLGK